jgi:hypothetical protein
MVNGLYHQLFHDIDHGKLLAYNRMAVVIKKQIVLHQRH